MRRLPALCLALVIGATLASASPAAAMTFKQVTDDRLCADRVCIAGSGLIDEDTVEAFHRAADQAPRGSLVILDSEGGVLVEALELGVNIRKAGHSTHVQAHDVDGRLTRGGVCASACAYAFLGGVSRTVGEAARVGVHQLHASRGELTPSDVQLLMALIAVHIKRLDGSLDLLISAFRTPPRKMHWLSPTELVRFNVVTAESPLLAHATPGARRSADAD